jgi:hypothetical protein
MKLFINDEIKYEIINHINQAKEEICLALYYFTDEDIFDALYRKLLNPKIKGYFIFHFNENNYSEIINNEISFNKNVKDEFLIKLKNLEENSKNNRIKYKLIGNSDERMHHKVIIIDRYILGIGSYNFTNQAHKRNYESYAFIQYHENPEHFQKILNEIYNILNIELDNKPAIIDEIKILPVFPIDDSLKIFSDTDTQNFLYPLKPLLIIEGRNIQKVCIEYSKENPFSKYFNFDNTKNKIPILLDIENSQTIQITVIGLDNKPIQIKRHINIIDKPFIKSNEIFNNLNLYIDNIISNFSKTFDNTLKKY